MRLPPAASFAAALLALTPAVAPAPAPAQVIEECGWVGSPANIVEPWQAHSRTYANGAIRIALLDTEEPVCCAAHLLVLSPSGQDEGPGYRQCHVVSDRDGGLGFNLIDFDAIASSYDPALGLRLDVPFWRYTDGRDRGRPGALALRINQASGAVTLEPAAP